jgi:hypothetical protein
VAVAPAALADRIEPDGDVGSYPQRESCGGPPISYRRDHPADSVAREVGLDRGHIVEGQRCDEVGRIDLDCHASLCRSQVDDRLSPSHEVSAIDTGSPSNKAPSSSIDGTRTSLTLRRHPMTAERLGRARRVIGQHEFVGWYFLLWFFILLVVPLFAVIALLWSVGNRRARERDDWPDRR